MKETLKKIWAKKWLKRLMIILLSAILLFTVLQVIPPKKVMENNPFLKADRVLVAAHRGGKNLNPENTFKAFDYAINELDVDILELDLVLTKDHHLVSIHNATINSTSDVEEVTGSSEPYYVSDHTLEELLNFNFGYKFKDKNGNYPYRSLVGFNDENRREILKANNLNIVTIDEIFARYKNKDIMFIVEIKDSGDKGKLAADMLYDLLVSNNLLQRVTIGTFHTEIAKYMETNYSTIIRGGSVGDVASFVVTQMLKVNFFDPYSFACLQIPVSEKAAGITLKLDKATYIKRAHRRGISVQFWTINDKDQMRHLIELGADVIMTDDPDVLNELLIEMGYK